MSILIWWRGYMGGAAYTGSGEERKRDCKWKKRGGRVSPDSKVDCWQTIVATATMWLFAVLVRQCSNGTLLIQRQNVDSVAFVTKNEQDSGTKSNYYTTTEVTLHCVCQAPSNTQTDTSVCLSVCLSVRLSVRLSAVSVRGVHPIAGRSALCFIEILRSIKIREQPINTRNLVSWLAGKSSEYCH